MPEPRTVSRFVVNKLLVLSGEEEGDIEEDIF